MSRLRVVTIVEGYGEVAAVPILLERIWRELLGGEYLDIIRPPIRQPRNQLAVNKDGALERAIGLAAARLASTPSTGDPELILLLIDADTDAPCQLGPRLLDLVREARGDRNIACALANVEFESWFVAAAESLAKYLNLAPGEPLPQRPEEQRLGKGWIAKRFNGAKYSESIDQAKLTAHMDLSLCRTRAPSFDKLCRELERFA